MLLDILFVRITNVLVYVTISNMVDTAKKKTLFGQFRNIKEIMY